MRIDPTVISPLGPLMIAYGTAMAKAKDPNHGKVDTLQKNETRKTLEDAIRA